MLCTIAAVQHTALCTTATGAPALLCSILQCSAQAATTHVLTFLQLFACAPSPNLCVPLHCLLCNTTANRSCLLGCRGLHCCCWAAGRGCCYSDSTKSQVAHWKVHAQGTAADVAAAAHLRLPLLRSGLALCIARASVVYSTATSLFSSALCPTGSGGGDPCSSCW